jgi:hypothetical protein
MKLFISAFEKSVWVRIHFDSSMRSDRAGSPEQFATIRRGQMSGSDTPRRTRHATPIPSPAQIDQVCSFVDLNKNFCFLDKYKNKSVTPSRSSNLQFFFPICFNLNYNFSFKFCKGYHCLSYDKVDLQIYTFVSKLQLLFRMLFIQKYIKGQILKWVIAVGHGELLELRLLKKSARHDFIIARHHSSNNIYSCHLLKSS